MSLYQSLLIFGLWPFLRTAQWIKLLLKFFFLLNIVQGCMYFQHQHCIIDWNWINQKFVVQYFTVSTSYGDYPSLTCLYFQHRSGMGLALNDISKMPVFFHVQYLYCKVRINCTVYSSYTQILSSDRMMIQTKCMITLFNLFIVPSFIESYVKSQKCIQNV